MRNISDIHLLLDTIERKQQGVYHTDKEKDDALDAGQKELFKECYKNKEWEAIDVFKVTNEPITTASDGIVDYPSDFEYFKMIFAGSLAAPITIRFVEEDELPDAITSQLRKVTIKNPIAVKSTNSGIRGINLYPQAIYNTFLTYYSLPETPKYGFTQSGRVVTYNPQTSVQLQFTDIYVDRIIAKALGYLGISMNEDDIVKFGQIKEQSA